MGRGAREKNIRMRASSPTGASAHAYSVHGDRLGELEQKFPLQPGQSGAVLALGDSLCLDYVSRPDAFERLYPRLLRGYMLDALERLDQPRSDGIKTFVDAVTSAGQTRRPSAGLGEDLRLDGADVVGSGLELDGELLQLSVFTSARESRRFGRIARPSRRQA